MLLTLICGFSHLDAQTTYDGTELSPGDVFLSYGNHGHADAGQMPKLRPMWPLCLLWTYSREPKCHIAEVGLEVSWVTS